MFNSLSLIYGPLVFLTRFISYCVETPAGCKLTICVFFLSSHLFSASTFNLLHSVIILASISGGTPKTVTISFDDNYPSREGRWKGSKERPGSAAVAVAGRGPPGEGHLCAAAPRRARTCQCHPAPSYVSSSDFLISCSQSHLPAWCRARHSRVVPSINRSP